jgi:RNA polymerase subunit RPABC4/transcription elongation factor Spt4
VLPTGNYKIVSHDMNTKENSSEEEKKTKLCPECRSEVDVKAKRCPNCRHKLPQGMTPVKWLIAIIVILMVGSIVTAEKPEKAAEPVLSAEQLAAWQKTPGGKICAAHPDWKHEDCDEIAKGAVWVGMTYDQLVLSYKGKPDDANPSSNGGNIHYQYCWRDKNPSCFYDNNEDGIIDAIN